MFKKFIKEIITECLIETLPVQKDEEKFTFIFETLKDIELTDGEKSSLTKYGNDKILTTVLNKILLGLSARALSSHSIEDIAELRGGVKTLQFLQSELTRYKPKQLTDKVTGELI